MEIRRVRYGEYRELIDVMNESFGFTEEKAKFEHILPKLYWQDNPAMVHIGAFEEGRLVSSIGIYPMELVNGSNRLQTACIGAVSTLPDFRGRGFFRNVMTRVLEEARSMGLDLLFLGGDRLRYSRFGFEFGGRNLCLNINRRTRSLLSPEAFEVLPFDDSVDAVTARLLEIYDSEPMRVTRTASEFGSVLRSWNAVPYYVKSEGRIVGYFSLAGATVTELSFECSLDTMFAAILSLCGNADVALPMSFYTPDVLSKVDNYVVTQNHMFNVLNVEAVIRFLGADPAAVLPLLSDDWRTMTRQLLGDCANDSLTGTNIFISAANAG